MQPRHIRAALLATLAALLLASGLAPAQAAASDEATEGETITTVLHPGWNMVGWVGPETPTSELFEALPQLRRVSAWDAGEGAYLRAFRGRSAELPSLTPGTGLWLHLGGDTTVEWTRPVSGEAVLLSLRTGRNLVGWTGEDSAPIEEAVGRFGDTFTRGWRWDPESQHFDHYHPGRNAANTLAELNRGDALWVELTAEARWWQPGTVRPGFVFDDDVGAEERDSVRALFASAEDFVARRFGAHTADYTVSVSNEHDVCAVDEDLVLFPYSCNPNAPHEYFHVLQNALARVPPWEYWGPVWLSEGSAEYAQHMWALERGVASRQPKFAVEQVIKTPDELHTFDPRDRYLPYALGFLAAEWLANHAGEESLVEYYRLGTSYERWEDAFKVAFGIEIDDFYREFAVHRQTVAPTLPHLIDDHVEPIVVALSDAAVPAAAAIEAEIARLSGFYSERFGGVQVDYSVYVVDAAAFPSTFTRAFGTDQCVPWFTNDVMVFVFDCPDTWLYPTYEAYVGDFYTSLFLNQQHLHKILFALAPAFSLPHDARGSCQWGPLWICVGVERYATHIYEIAAGRATSDDVRATRLSLARGTTLPLSSFEDSRTVNEKNTAINAASESALFSLAAEWLAAHAGDRAILEYFRLLPPLDTVDAAFEQAFGLTLDDFYEQFEAFRATLQ